MNTQPNNPNPPNPNAPDPLAVALAKLDPAPHGFEWNSLMFAAGRASKTRALNFWRAIAGLCAVVACGFALAYFTRSEVVRERVVYVERAPQKVAEPPPARSLTVPGVKPNIPTVPKAEIQPESSPLTEPPLTAPLGWSFDPAPEPGTAMRWYNMRNDVLTVGLSVLPDSGRKAPPPRRDK